MEGKDKRNNRQMFIAAVCLYRDLLGRFNSDRNKVYLMLAILTAMSVATFIVNLITIFNL